MLDRSRSAVDERVHLANVRIERVDAVENYFNGLVWKSRLKCERVAGEDIASVVCAQNRKRIRVNTKFFSDDHFGDAFFSCCK